MSNKLKPKNPKYVEVEEEDLDWETGESFTYYTTEALCGRCNEFIGHEGNINFNYCPYCGQKIKLN